MKYLIIILFSLAFATGCEEKVYEDLTNNYINIVKSEIDVYSDIFLLDIIEIRDNDNVKIDFKSNNYQIDTLKLGKKEYDIYYQVEDKLYVKKFTIEIVDKEAPKIFSGTNKTIKINYNKDLCDLITYGDNYDGELLCEITGEYDLSKEGIYHLNYSISDKSNNIKETKVILNVKEKIAGSDSSTTKKKILFSEVLKEHKSNETEVGIDVSKWQGKIDFEKVKSAGASFVMMRIGVQKSVKGELEIDPYYIQNMKKAKEAGLKVGVYLYSIATSAPEAKHHAEWVIKTLNREKLDLPVVFDWENWANWNSYKLSFYEINNIANTFLRTIEDNGYIGMLYGSKFYLESIWINKFQFPVWLAHYTEKTTYMGDYMMWQLCNNGKIDGINGDVDIDILYHLP